MGFPNSSPQMEHKMWRRVDRVLRLYIEYCIIITIVLRTVASGRTHLMNLTSEKMGSDNFVVSLVNDSHIFSPSEIDMTQHCRQLNFQLNETSPINLHQTQLSPHDHHNESASDKTSFAKISLTFFGRHILMTAQFLLNSRFLWPWCGISMHVRGSGDVSPWLVCCEALKASGDVTWVVMSGVALGWRCFGHKWVLGAWCFEFVWFTFFEYVGRNLFYFNLLQKKSRFLFLTFFLNILLDSVV